LEKIRGDKQVTGGETGTDKQAGKSGTGAGKETSRGTGGETGTDRQAGKPGTGSGKETSRLTCVETGIDRQAGKPGTGAGKETSRGQVEERPGGELTRKQATEKV
jgi:hypothetical protein